MSAWITVNSAATLLGVHPRTVIRWCHSRAIRYYKPGREFLFKAEWLEEFMQRRTFQPTARVAGGRQ